DVPECRADAVKSGDVLLQLTPGGNETDGSQVFQSQFPVGIPLYRPAADVDLRQKPERTEPFEVFEKQRILTQSEKTLMADLGHFFDQLFLFSRQRIAFFLLQMRRQSGMQQLLNIVICRIPRAILTADRLSLNGQLNMIVGNLSAHGGIKPLCFSAAAGWWSASAVEKDKVDVVSAGERGQLNLSLVNRPVGHEVSAILGAV